MNTQDPKGKKVSSKSQVPVRSGYSLVVVILIVIGVVILGIMGANKAFNAAIKSGEKAKETGKGLGHVDDGLAGMSAAWTENSNDKVLREAVMEGKTGLVKFSIKSGANVNVRFKSGATLLHRAASDGSLEIARMLIENEVNVDAKNKKGDTPLHIAARKGWFEIVKLLIENHADINARNEERNSVLNVALSGLKDLSRGNTIENQQTVIDLLGSYGAED